MGFWDARRARRVGGAVGAGEGDAGAPTAGGPDDQNTADGGKAFDGEDLDAIVAASPPTSARGPVASVVDRVRAAAEALGLAGEVVAFGSHLNGLNTASSDFDLSYMPAEGDPSADAPVRVLQRFANELPNHGFYGIITIFHATVPLVKAVDMSGTEVDLCVGNLLGHQNSKLIATYCALDPRVAEVGKLVKQWAKAKELVGSSDGHLNSYAYTLLTIYFLMQASPPVVPNLQDLALQGCEPVLIRDRRWGREIPWDCRFWEDTGLVPRSANTESVESLLRGFFRFYTQAFDWGRDAVSIRTALTARACATKFDLHTSVQQEQWMIEDPFDLRHNLASQCTKEGRQRILQHMAEVLGALDAVEEGLTRSTFAGHCSRAPTRFLLKCRVHTDKVSAPDLMGALTAVRGLGPFSMRFPTPRPSGQKELVDAFAVFTNEEDRARVHRLNETYVGEWQLRLLPCSSWALEDARRTCDYDELDALARPVPEDGAGEATASEEVRSGIRAAQSESEVEVLIQRAQALGLIQEEDLGRCKLRQLSVDRPQDAPGEEPEGKAVPIDSGMPVEPAALNAEEFQRQIVEAALRELAPRLPGPAHSTQFAVG